MNVRKLLAPKRQIELLYNSFNMLIVHWGVSFN